MFRRPLNYTGGGGGGGGAEWFGGLFSLFSLLFLRAAPEAGQPPAEWRDADKIQPMTDGQTDRRRTGARTAARTDVFIPFDLIKILVRPSRL